MPTKPGPALAGAAPDERAGKGWRSPLVIGMALLATASLVALYFRWFLTQNAHSASSADWSHAYIVPLISGYIVWTRREAIARLRPTAFWPGLAPLLLGVVCYFFFIAGIPNHMLQGFSLVLTIFGLTLLLLGPRMMQALFVPIGYLLFGVTIAEMIMLKVTYQLQMMASQGSYILLNIIGPLFGAESTEIAGNTLTIFRASDGAELPLNVAEACSGMRMLVGFFALGVAVAIVSCRHWWQRVALVILAAPVAVLTNVLRVTTLGVASLYNQDLAVGDAHMFIGVLWLIPGFLLFMGITWALNKIVAEPRPGPDKPKQPAAASGRRAFPVIVPRKLAPAYIVGITMLLTSALALGTIINALGLQLRKLPIEPATGLRFHSMPIEFPHWSRYGQEQPPLSKEVLETLGTSNYLSRHYVNTDTAEGVKRNIVELHCAYYTGSVDTVPHVPERCFVGGGMSITGGPWVLDVPIDTSAFVNDSDLDPEMHGRVMLAQTSPDSSRPNQRVHLPRDLDKLKIRITEYGSPDGQRMFAGYFFIANGGTVPNAEGVRLLAFDLRDTYSYYAKVQFSSATVESAPELADIAGSMLTEMFPEIMLRLPDWVDVRSGRYPTPTTAPGAGNQIDKAVSAPGVGRPGRVAQNTDRG
ncbi:MAG: exosortase-associated EpsI family protein [Phycisphaeraceae bacterium]|nr:exosortase-associated EpsI family protein [Phycisphaeraceae bacterium]MCB9848718.1 exosortase-associated EpsI family protein [Phycisphaeraceae bacterium]